MQVSVCLGTILIPEYLDSILVILLLEYIPEYILNPEYSQTNAPKMCDIPRGQNMQISAVDAITCVKPSSHHSI